MFYFHVQYVTFIKRVIKVGVEIAKEFTLMFFTLRNFF